MPDVVAQSNFVGCPFVMSLARDRQVTLLYSARDIDHNQAVALAEYLAAKAD